MNNENNNSNDNIHNYEPKNVQSISKVFGVLLGVIFVIFIAFGIFAWLINSLESYSEEKQRQEKIEQEAKKLDEEYFKRRLIEDPDFRKEYEAKKRQEEEHKKKVEMIRKKREERLNREEEIKELTALSDALNFVADDLMTNMWSYLELGDEKLAELLENRLSELVKLGKNKPYLSMSNKFNMCMSDYISHALDRDYFKVIEVLIKRKILIPRNRKINYMPLSFYTAEQDSRKCLELILKEGYDLKEELDDKAKEPGLTLLHSAAKKGNLSLAKRVLDAGVTVDKKTNAGMTPLDYAIKNNQKEIALFLIEKGAKVNPETMALATDSAMLEILRK